MTFKELDTFSDKLATALADMGIGKGSTVGLFTFNSPEFIVSLFGVLKTGAAVTALNPSLREGEAKYQLEDSESVAVIAGDETYPVFRNIRFELPKLKNAIVFKERHPDVLSLWELIGKYPPNPPKVEINPTEDLALLQYTADGKGCMLTHYNVVTNPLQLSEMLGLRESRQDVIMGHLPFSHIYGIMFSIFLPIHTGSCSLVLERRFDIEEILSHIERFKVTIFPTVMPVISFLIDASELLKKYDLSSLRFICSGAMPIKAGVARELQHLIGVTVIQGYGLSEAPSVTHLNPLNKIKLESVGVPIPGTEQKIVDLETGEKELQPGEVGEVAVRGPQVMKGYWKRPEETAEVLRNGWLYTGDIGKINEDGYLHIVGRKKDIIKFKGFAIGLDELEEVLRKHSAVEECVVVPKPSPIAGEIPKAFVALRKGFRVDQMELIEFVEARVAGFKKIREIEFVEEIPKNPVDRMVYRKRLIGWEMERAGIQVKQLVDKMIIRIRRQAVGMK